jgi:hypothetical protein
MKDKLWIVGMILAATLLGYWIRGPINGYRLANWINGSCEIKHRDIRRDPAELKKGETDFYIHCE